VRMGGAWVCALVATGALVGGVGCRQVLGLQGYSRATDPSSGGDSGSGGDSATDTDTCDTCLPVDCIAFDPARLTSWAAGTDRPALPTSTDPEPTTPPATTVPTPEQPPKNPCSELPNPVYVSGS
jgi:hypothetical protein